MKTLLIADDEPGVRALVRMTLERNNFTIVEATNGAEALELALHHRPDLVLLDVMMPIMTGIEVCRAIKSAADLSHTTVVLLTAKAQEHDRLEGKSAGADEYFTKPFSPLALLRKVDDVLHVGPLR